MGQGQSQEGGPSIGQLNGMSLEEQQILIVYRGPIPSFDGKFRYKLP